MTIDERLEALAQTVELMARDQLKRAVSDERHQKRHEELQELLKKFLERK